MAEREKKSFLKKLFSSKRNIVIALVVIAVLALGFFMTRTNVLKQNDPSIGIDKKYSIVARTSQGQGTDGQLGMKVTNAIITDSIVKQGQTAHPVKGKKFLVVEMEFANPYKVTLYSFPVDLFRLVRSDGARIAPNVDQGTVEVRAESTKKSNLAFVILPSDRKFKIEVGEIGGNKQILQINF